MTASPLVIAEVLEHILRFLDQRALCHAVLVSKSWNSIGTPILWRRLTCYNLSESFVKGAKMYGHNIISLNLFIDLWGPHKTEECERFDTLLQYATRLRRIRLRPAHECDPHPGCVSSVLHEAIMRHAAERLEELRVNFTFLTPENASTFFRRCTKLKALDISASRRLAEEICASELELEELQLCPSAEANDPMIGNINLLHLGEWMTRGKTFVMRHFLFTEAALRLFLSVCSKTLTRIGFAGCEDISSSGFQQMTEMLPLLENVDVSGTQACDATILKLAQMARAPRLRVLIVSECKHITSLSIRQVVTCCENLDVLDCESCPYVRMDIFDPPAPWIANKIQRLMIGGIHEDRARIGLDRPPPITDEYLVNMYEQISHLKRLQFLSLRSRHFSPKLLELGRTALESLPYLMAIDISTSSTHVVDPTSLRRDFIWLATCLPQLTYFTANQDDMTDDLRDDLMAINSKLKIELLDSDMDVIDDDDSGNDAIPWHYNHTHFGDDSDDDYNHDNAYGVDSDSDGAPWNYYSSHSDGDGDEPGSTGAHFDAYHALFGSSSASESDEAHRGASDDVGLSSGNSEENLNDHNSLDETSGQPSSDEEQGSDDASDKHQLSVGKSAKMPWDTSSEEELQSDDDALEYSSDEIQEDYDSEPCSDEDEVEDDVVEDDIVPSESEHGYDSDTSMEQDDGDDEDDQVSYSDEQDISSDPPDDSDVDVDQDEGGYVDNDDGYDDYDESD